MYIVNYMKEILMPGVCVLSKHIHCRKNIYHIFQNKIREKGYWQNFVDIL